MGTKIRGIDFGPICGASGVQGFFGDPRFPEYWHQHLFRYMPGYNFKGMSFTSKTSTALKRAGNMSLREDGIRVKHIRPRCIETALRQGVVLNAVGLSGPGFEKLLLENRWQKREKPFRISFMAVGQSLEEKVKETKLFASLMKKHLPSFKTKEIMIQFNITCPNVGIKPSAEGLRDVEEVRMLIDILAEIGLALEVKVSAVMDPYVVREIASHEACDSVCVSNTIPWSKLEDMISWRKLFRLQGEGSHVTLEESPLKQFGGGGLSGWPLLQIVSRWIREFRAIGFEKHINAGGGIMSRDDVYVMKYAGADSVFIGSVAVLRPWRVKGIIREARRAFT
ncbi:MAG: Dihydroorotate dehydrogenase [Candidatus Parcubacteria bacterium]|jgi:dihydroorotate dehydrogenase